MRWFGRSALLLCAWVLWQMLVVDHEYRYVPVAERGASQEACVAEVAKLAPYERRARPLVWYADISQPTTRPIWHGCFPADYDPRDR